MGSKTKIVILQTKELIYTGIFVVLGILFILLLIFMFFPSNKKSKETATYQAGVYSSCVTLGDTALNVEVTVDQEHINSVRILHMDESITTMYPLLEPALEEINAQLPTLESIDDLSLSEENLYTTTLLNQAIKTALKKATLKKCHK